MAKRAKVSDPLLHSLVRDHQPKKGELRKMEIIRAALDLISHDGIENLSYESIAQSLGIRRSHVAYHFDDKTEIVFRAIQYVLQAGTELVIAAIAANDKPQQKLQAYVYANFEWFKASPDYATVFNLFLYYARFEKRFQTLQAESQREGVLRIKEILQEGLIPSSGKIHGLNAEQLAEQIQALIAGYLFYSVFPTKPKPSAQDWDEVADKAWSGVLALLRT